MYHGYEIKTFTTQNEYMYSIQVWIQIYNLHVNEIYSVQNSNT